MDTIQSIVTRHLMAWSSPSGGERSEEIAAIYAEDVYLGGSEAASTGHDGVEHAISGLQGALPGMVLTQRGSIQTAQDMSTYAWELGPVGQPAAARGRDVIFVKDSQISRIYVVIDA